MPTEAPTATEEQKKRDAEEARKRDEAEKNKPLVDSLGGELHVGDTITIEGTVTEVGKGPDGKITVSFENLASTEAALANATPAERVRLLAAAKLSFSIPGSRAKKILAARIGAAPKLRTPVDEVPHPLGGVKIVPRDSTTGRTEDIPNASPAARAAVRADEHR